MRYLPVILISCLLSCKGDEEDNSSNYKEDEIRSEVIFDTYNQKISYCIGLDHARGCYNVYTAANANEAFNVGEIENGMVDYLIGNELRINFFEKDSLLNLYLLDSGKVDQSAVSKNDASYCVGMDEAFNLVSSLVNRKIDQDVDVDFMVTGISEGMSNTSRPTIPFMDSQREVHKYYSDINEENGVRFLKENRLVEGVIETESGLQYKIIRDGKGKIPNITDSVTIHYTGRFVDGRVFESTIPSSIPYSGPLLGLIVGWQEGVMLMKEGGQSRLYIPYELAYGEAGKGVVEPYSTLIFDMELMAVKRFK